MKILFFTLITIICSACAVSAMDLDLNKLWNIPSSGTSTFDNQKYIRMSNIGCGEIILELYQDENKAKRSEVLLKAGLREITNIGGKNALKFKVNGKAYNYSSNDAVTEHDEISFKVGTLSTEYPYSYKTYLVPESFIKNAAKSKEFLVRMTRLNNTYTDGKCTPLTQQEVDAQSEKHGVKVTEEHIRKANEISGVNGFKEFVRMMNDL